MNAEEFKQKTGCAPEDDDLERVNCPKAGQTGHLNCGWCDKHDHPVFECTETMLSRRGGFNPGFRCDAG